MAVKVNGVQAIHVKLIHLANGETLEDRDVFIANGFLIVEADNEEQAPTWYNLQNVQMLQEVTIDEPRRARPQIAWL